MRSVLLLIAFVMIRLSCLAQDPHFSQFYASPLTLNPAFTGKFDGDLRIAGNYRNQWPTINKAFTTGTASLDFHILQNKLSDVDTWGVGLLALTDQSAAGAVKYNYAAISTAFHKGLDEDGYTQIGFGFQGTFSNMMINTSKLTFENELDANGTWSNPSGETFNGLTLKNNYFDLNTGVLFTTSKTDQDNFYAGVSMYHVLRPKQTFTQNSYYVLNPRFTLQAGGFFPAGDNFTLHLSALHSLQAGAHETLVGGALQMPVNTETTDNPVSFFAGGWYRFGDAMIPYLGLDYSDFRLGVSYDVNTSALKTASNSRGGIEISLIYIKKPAESKGLPCPRF